MAEQNIKVKFSTDGLDQVRADAERARRSYEDFLKTTEEFQRSQTEMAQAAARANRLIADSSGQSTALAIASYQRQKQEAQAAYEDIKKSGTSSASDIAQAQRLLIQRMTELDRQLANTSGGFGTLKGSIAGSQNELGNFRSVSVAATGTGGWLAGLTSAVEGLAGAWGQVQTNIQNALGLQAQAKSLRSPLSDNAAQQFGSGDVVGFTGQSGRVTGEHLDVRFKDRRFITASDADKYILVDGKAPSSYGVTSGYGPRSLGFSPFHAGVDLATPAGLPITLKPGVKFLRRRDQSETGGGGFVIEVETPEGIVQLLHLSDRVPTSGNPTNSLPEGLPSGSRTVVLPGLPGQGEARIPVPDKNSSTGQPLEPISTDLRSQYYWQATKNGQFQCRRGSDNALVSHSFCVLAGKGNPNSTPILQRENQRDAISRTLKSLVPNTPITAEDVTFAAAASGVKPDALITSAFIESTLGTKGRAVASNNPLNYGNDDDGNTRNFKTIREGLTAAALGLKQNYGISTAEDFIARDFRGKYGRYTPNPNYKTLYEQGLRQVRAELYRNSPQSEQSAIDSAGQAFADAQEYQRRLVEDARRRAEAQQRQRDQIARQQLSDRQKFGETQLQVELAGQTDPIKREVLEQRLESLRRENELARERLQIQQAIAQLEVERQQKIRDQKSGLQGDPKDFSAEIDFLRSRLDLLGKTNSLEQQIQTNRLQREFSDRSKRTQDQVNAELEKLGQLRSQTFGERQQPFEEQVRRYGELKQAIQETIKAKLELQLSTQAEMEQLLQLEKLLQGILELRRAENALTKFNELEKGNDAIAQYKARAEEVQKISDSIGSAITSNISSAFDGLLNGTQTFGQAILGLLSGILKQIAQLFLQSGLNGLQGLISGGLSGILGGLFGGGSAAGGIGASIVGSGFNFGSALGFAEGGLVFGPGTETSDSIPAMLSRNEYVVNAEAVRRIGVQRLEAMNRARSQQEMARALLADVPRLAAGGMATIGASLPSYSPAPYRPTGSGGNGGSPAITTNITVVTPNPDGFRASERQLGKMASDQVERGLRRR